MNFLFKWQEKVSALIWPLILMPATPAMASDYPSKWMIENISSDAILMIIYVVLALGCSFLCSVAEAVLLSITPSYIEEQKKDQPKRAALLKRLKQDNVDRSLAAILTLNTIAHTVGAMMAGAKAAVIFGSTGVGIFSAIMTLMILFLSEILPKSIGVVYWPKLTVPTAFFVQFLIVTLYPIVWISENLTRFISRGKTIHIFSRDEFMAMARVGEQTGQIQDNEAKIIRNLFLFGSLNVTEIMTPRTVISALPEEITILEASERIVKTTSSRLPVFNKGIDQITGFVLKDDILLNRTLKRDNEMLLTLKREISFVPKSVSLTALLETFLKDRQHIAIIVDEYGGTAGLVTLEDLVETLMGMEIMDETDTVADMRVLARKKWEERVKTFTRVEDHPL